MNKYIHTLINTVKFDTEKVRSSIVDICQQFHQDVIALSADFLSSLKRRNYVTPTSYLELIVAFKQNLDLKRLEGTRSHALSLAIYFLIE